MTLLQIIGLIVYLLFALADLALFFGYAKPMIEKTKMSTRDYILTSSIIAFIPIINIVAFFISIADMPKQR